MSPTKSYNLKDLGPLRLEGHIQRYAWGKVGTASRIAPFLREPISDLPLAEYWLGSHPKGPAVAVLPDGSRCPITELLPKESPLGFMLKVLSINPAFGLSIQSHPDTALAQQLHARDPEHYPDPFHKPEVGIALTPVKLLYNIKSQSALHRVIEYYPEILRLLSEETLSGLEPNGRESSDRVVTQVDWSAEVRRGIFSDCINAEPEAVSRAVKAICERHTPSLEGSTPEEVLIIRRLAETYGTGDAGLVVLLLMNLVSLAPGEGIFIAPNIPHAYLDGDLVECMACSDNVIRAGLTNKFRDVKTLLETTAFDVAEEPKSVSTREAAAPEFSTGYRELLLPAKEFNMGVVQPGVNRVTVDLAGGPAIALCLGGRAVVSFGLQPDGMTLGDGDALLLPERLADCKVSTESGQLFIARSGVINDKRGFL